jgi:hypothetical protein
MAAYERYEERERERERPRRYVREERYEERERERDRDFGRYDTSDSYLNPYQSSRDLVPRVREDTDMAVEEIRREFPPPSSRDVRRARSVEPVYEEYDVGYRRRYDSRYDPRYDRDSRDSRDSRDRDWDRDRDYYMPAKVPRKPTASLAYRDEDEVDEEEAARRRMHSKQEKILAALAGAALFVGGKEMYDRHEAKQNDERDVQRNYLASAAIGAAGALAGYQGAEFYSKQRTDKEKEKKKQQQMVLQGRGVDDDMTVATRDKDRDRDGGERDRDAPHKEGEKEKEGETSSDKNLLEKLLASAGLAGAVGALTGKKVDGKDGAKLPEGLSKVSNAARASIVAGAAEAFRVAKEPGGWKGEKTKRIMTAAIGAASIDAAQNDKKNSSLKLAESVMGGLLGNRVINGSKSNIEEDKLTGRSRSRSRAAAARPKSTDNGAGAGALGGMGGLAALATAGLGALGGKKLYDNYRDESPDGKDRRSRSRRRDDDDGSPPRRSRSRSVVDSARKSLAKLGIGNGPDEGKDSHRRDQDDFGRSSSRPRRRYSDDYDDDRDRDRDRRRRRDYDDDDDDYYNDRRRDRSRPRRARSRADESDLGDSSDDDKQSKKLKDRRH